jgi:hypothetical protein
VNFYKDDLARNVLDRVGFHEIFKDEARKDDRWGTCGKELLQVDHHRLKYLQEAYASYDCPATVHSCWNAKLLEGIDWTDFRGDSAYMWELRDGNVPLTYLATYMYQRRSRDNDLLSLCEEDDSFGAFAISVEDTFVTRDRLDSVAELGFIRDCLGLTETSEFTVLDIGAGYGRLAWRLSQCFPHSRVFCADALAESSYLCERYLAYRRAPDRVRTVPLFQLTHELAVSQIDLAVAINSLSECTAAAARWWCDLLEAHQIPNILLVPPSITDQGRQVLSCDHDLKDRVNIVYLLEERGYQRTNFRAKYSEQAMQRYGVSPTYFHLMSRVRR